MFSFFSISLIDFFIFWFSTIPKLILKTQTRSKLKQNFFVNHFKNMPESEFQSLCNDFEKKYFSKIIKQSFLEFLKKLDTSDKKVIVSASIKNYLKPWCDKNNFDLICTELEVVDEKLTGRFSTPNQNYQQKVNRIKTIYNLDNYNQIHVFGDSEGDLSMLELGTNKYYKYFK